MEIVIDSLLAKTIDKKATEIFGIDPLILMENAGERIYKEIVKRGIIKSNRVNVICGKGNNGGDAVVISRKLTEIGIYPKIFIFSRREGVSDLLSKNLDIAYKLGIDIIEVNDKNYSDLIKDILECDVIIDGLLGIGITEPVKGIYKNVIEDINQYFNGIVVSIDVPSGISLGKGFFYPILRADYTFTVEYAKINMIDYPGRDYCGEIIPVKIGFPKGCLDTSNYFLVKEEDIKLPNRNKNSHKGSYGRLLVIGGSSAYSGAPILSLRGGIESGCGLIYYFGYSENIVRVKYPEVIILDNIEYLPSFDSVVIGPGWEKDKKIFQTLMEKYKGNLVIDAEGINLISEDETVLRNRKNTLITPHVGEFARLIKKEIKWVKENKIEAIEIFASKYNSVMILLKDSVSILYSGGKFYYLDFGNDLLARGGSGDLLAGLIGGLSAYNSFEESVFIAHYIIGKASDNAKKMGKISLSTEFLIDYFYQ